ncbi:putative baseplate assembly protein [Streptosporangium sp. KLBMP 9127]|nr:putative baseplate assembly protein [Streptosporangium sp. KLBMP 9127]
MTSPAIDPRDAAAFVAELLARRTGYVPEWRPGTTGPDVALAEALARYLAAVATRLNQAPDKHQLAMLDLLGVRLIPARAARAPVVFTLSDTAGDGHIPAGTRLAAEAPGPSPAADAPATAQGGQILFETERSTGLMSGALVELRSLWPGRDQSIDHLPAFAAGEPFRPWSLPDLRDMPHHLYLAHRTVLALSAESHVAVEFELSQGSSEPLDSVWEYWDGQVWRPFANAVAACDRVAAAHQDSTARFQRSGTVHLITDCAETKMTEVDGVDDFWIRARLTEPLPPDPAQLLPEIERIRLATVITRRVGQSPPAQDPPEIVGGFLPDQGVADGAAADLSTPFYPFGLQPQPGSVFYFSSTEVFTKPGADLRICFVRTPTPQDEVAADGEEPLPHRVAWEYWNGRGWAALPGPGDLTTGPADLDPPATAPFGTVRITVPADMEPTAVAGVEARWMRVRLVSGGFGVKRVVTWTDTGTGTPVSNTFTYVVSRPPALSAFKLGYTWTSGPVFPDRVLTYNDFQYTDRTYEAVWPGRVLRPFTPSADLTPALYLGFDKPLPADRLGLFLDIEEDPAETLGPAHLWEYWDGGAWRALPADDETRRLRLPGLVGLVGPGDAQPLARFGTARSWLRVRLKEDGPPGAPLVCGVFPNATWAAQYQTVLDDPVGAGTAMPDQVLAFRQSPVLPGEHIEVRELAGPRAAVEWRIVALELFPQDGRVVREIETLLGREGAGDVEYGPLRLRLDRAKQVSEVWVRWTGHEHLTGSGPNDRHYALERSRGRLRFGDGTHGRVPPAGAAILARRYQTGGGGSGNVPAGAISQLHGAFGGVERVANPVPAEGGADAETLRALRARGPATLRHRGRALSAADLAALAREASPAVAVARAIPARSADGGRRPGHVTLIIIPAVADPRPWPSFGLREHVRRYVEERAAAAPAGLRHIEVTGPQYLPVDVEATIIPRDPAEAGPVEQRVRAVLTHLLHPLYGGPEGDGWRPGRAVHLSDVATTLTRVDGLDHVERLAISTGGRLAGERLDVAPHRIVVAGELRLRPAQR